MNVKLSGILICVFCFLSCKNNSDGVKPETNSIKVELVNKEYFFDKAKYGDTIKYKFLIKNLSNGNYKINKVGTSCGCTTVNFTKKDIESGGFAVIDVRYVPSADDIGVISKSIVVSDNSNDGFNTMYIRGEIVK